MQKKTQKYIGISIFLVVSIIGLARLTSEDLDKQAEATTQKMFKRNKYGIIEGAEPIIYKNGYNQAIILIHGFESTPAVFKDLVHDIKGQANSDIYVPLLPYDGRDLQTLSKTDDHVVVNYIDELISDISKKYQRVIVVGLSYGGAKLAKLAATNKIPPNVTLIFYAPSFYITSNTLMNRNLATIYRQWRNYCNNTILGCGLPNYASADEEAEPQFAKQKDFNYIDIHALLALYRFDLENRGTLGKIHRTHSIIMAEDDNQVNYNKIKGICVKNNEYCKFYSFKSGRHLIHWGKNKQSFENLLVKIANN